MNNIVTRSNLDAGILWWRTETRWPKDFHNRLYSELHELKQDRLGDEWWREIVDILSRWYANRPKSKKVIYERGLERLAELNKHYSLILAKNMGREPDLTTTNWEQLSGLFGIAASIKSVESPVFPSKLCHFILHSAFPVIDRQTIGLRDYERYWSYCRTLWIDCTEKEKLIRALKGEISAPVTPGYPWATKIVELCLIGSSHRT